MLSQQTITRYHTLCRGIAQALDATWTPSPAPVDPCHDDYRHRHQTLTLNNGRSILLAFDTWQNEGRISIYGRYPKYLSGQEIRLRRTAPSITVSQSRPIPTIAADIKRRFLSDFNAYCDDCRPLQDSDAAAVAQTRHIAAMLMQYAGCAPQHNACWQTPDEITESMTKVSHKKAYDIRIVNGHISIERINSLDPETAVEILRLLG